MIELPDRGGGHAPAAPADPRRIERVGIAGLRLAAPDGVATFAQVRAVLLAWLAAKMGRALPPAMARGDTDAIDSHGELRTETAGLNEPLFWALRRDDRDAGRLTWVTEASMALDGPCVRLGVRLHLTARGEPPRFRRSLPSFLRTIARDHAAWLDGLPVGLAPEPVDLAEEVDALVRLLDDPARQSPVLAISADRDDIGGEHPLVDDERLGAAVFGAAHVRRLSWRAALALTDRLGKRLSCFRGAVRVWAPGRVSGSDPYAHQLFVADRLADAANPVADLVDATLRYSAIRRDADQVAPPFVEIRRAVRALSPPTETAEPALPEQLAELQVEYDQYAAMADAELSAARSERDEARAEINALRARLGHLEAALRERLALPALDLPDDFDELAGWCARHLDERVVVHPRALRLARKSPFEQPRLAYQALVLLRDGYVPMRRGERGLRAGWEDGLRQLGLDLAPTFAGARAGQFGDEYVIEWRGRRRPLDMHLKGSNSRNPRYGFRLYFFWCEETRAAVVGALPSHLTNDAS